MEKTIEEVVKAVEQLPQDQLKQFRVWFQKFDMEIWKYGGETKQMIKAIKAGEFDTLAQVAIADHKTGIKHA